MSGVNYSFPSGIKGNAGTLYGSGTYLLGEWRALKTATGNRCLRCLRSEEEILQVTGKRLTGDHIIPVTCGGTNTIHNIQPLCMPCNQWKGTRIMDFRLPDRFVD